MHHTLKHQTHLTTLPRHPLHLHPRHQILTQPQDMLLQLLPPEQQHQPEKD